MEEVIFELGYEEKIKCSLQGIGERGLLLVSQQYEQMLGNGKLNWVRSHSTLKEILANKPTVEALICILEK